MARKCRDKLIKALFDYVSQQPDKFVKLANDEEFYRVVVDKYPEGEIITQKYRELVIVNDVLCVEYFYKGYDDIKTFVDFSFHIDEFSMEEIYNIIWQIKDDEIKTK